MTFAGAREMDASQKHPPESGHQIQCQTRKSARPNNVVIIIVIMMIIISSSSNRSSNSNSNNNNSSNSSSSSSSRRRYKHYSKIKAVNNK